MLGLGRPRYLLSLLLRLEGSARGLATQPGERAVLERWLQSWELATPPVTFLPGTEPPTAMSWLRRRGPALPDALLQKLFRQEVVRCYDPATGQISRARKARPLAPGARLLVPRDVAASAAQQGAEGGRRRRHGAAAAELSPEQQELRLAAVRELRRRVLYSDSDLIVVDKPAGLAVQGGSGVALSVDDIMGAAFSRMVHDPSQLRLVHRLDQQTTGVLVIAKTPDAAAWLSQGFRGGSAGEAGAGASAAAGEPGRVEIRKTYWGVLAKQLPEDAAAVWERPEDLPERGTLDLPIAPGGASRPSAAGGRSGLPALTKFTLRRQDERLAWLELRPQTGRKHQLRIHCAQGLGAPILGDSKYGHVRSRAQREVLQQLRDEGAWEGSTPPMFLHCRSILIHKPGQREPLRFVAPPHPHWEALFRLQRWGEVARAQGERAAAAKRQPSIKRWRAAAA